jgi:hypothetical protein
MLTRLKYHLENKTKLWKVIMIISIVLFLAILIFISSRLLPRLNTAQHVNLPLRLSTTTPTVVQSTICADCIRRQLDGVYVDPDQANLPPVAVMIDNHSEARPQSGINQASLVYEAEVEGYYTRLMVIFASGDKINKIGPVRSARPYFVDWAQELQAVYGHCGGSPEALVDIEQKGLVDFDQFYNGPLFWRTDDRAAPHNIYTSSDNIYKFLAKKNVGMGNYIPWRFKDDSPANNSSSSQPILINYKAGDFKISWQYDRENNDYIRYFQASPELTADNQEIKAKNLIIQTVPATVIDNDLRLKMNDIGSGRATICLDGYCQPGSWSKADYSSRTKFSYDNGLEVSFNAGTTWIEVMRPN